MQHSIRMIVVLSLITLVSGLSLGGLHRLTYERAENNILKFKKIPAVADIYEVVAGTLPPAEREAVEEDLLAEKRLLDLGGDSPALLFVIRKDGEPYAVAVEDYGQGYGGDLGVMVGFRLDGGGLVGIGITTMSETPGLGTRVREAGFTGQFRGMGPDAVFRVRKDGGDIDAISGATVSSRAVAKAIEQAAAFYGENRDTILEAVRENPGGGS